MSKSLRKASVAKTSTVCKDVQADLKNGLLYYFLGCGFASDGLSPLCLKEYSVSRHKINT